MPPKPKKGKNKKKAPISLDDIDTTVFTREKLEEYCVNIYEEIKKEKQNTEFLRLDRDKLVDMVAISREELIHARDANRTKRSEIQDAEDNHRLVMWGNRQKLIYLSSEKNIECLDTKLETVGKISLEQINHEKRMDQILCDIKELTEEIKGLSTIYTEVKKNEQIKHAENKSQTRQTDKELHMLMESNREKTMAIKLKDLETKYDLEEKTLEKMKNKTISQLLKNNAKFSTDLKHYYNQIVNHNLSVINMMKTEFQRVKTKSAAIEKQCLQLKQDNALLLTSLNQSKMEEQQLQVKLASSGKDKNQLKYIKTELEESKVLLEQKKIELDVLKMRLDKEEMFTKEAISKANISMTKTRTTAEEIILLLEFMVTHLYHRNMEADSTLQNIKNICRREGKQSKALDSIPEFQNSLLDEMNFRIATVAQERDRILNAYKEMLTKYHLHMDDTGFNPLEVDEILKTAVSLRVFVVD